jgi:hypothetical protein
MKIGIKEINVETGEETFFERELTAAEIKKIKEREAEIKAKQAEIEEKEASRQAILDRLGLSADEVKLLLG